MMTMLTMNVFLRITGTFVVVGVFISQSITLSNFFNFLLRNFKELVIVEEWCRSQNVSYGKCYVTIIAKDAYVSALQPLLILKLCSCVKNVRT